LSSSSKIDCWYEPAVKSNVNVALSDQNGERDELGYHSAGVKVMAAGAIFLAIAGLCLGYFLYSARRGRVVG
jgi:hypothetical protein